MKFYPPNCFRWAKSVLDYTTITTLQGDKVLMESWRKEYNAHSSNRQYATKEPDSP